MTGPQQKSKRWSAWAFPVLTLKEKTMTDEKTRALIAEDLRNSADMIRDRGNSVATVYATTIEKLMRDAADALSALTVPDGDARERVMCAIRAGREARQTWWTVTEDVSSAPSDDDFIADAILSDPALPRAAAPEPEWEYGVQYMPPSAYAGEPVKCGSERAARLAVRGSSEPIRLLRRSPKVVHPAGPWEPLPVGGDDAAL